MTRKYDKQTGFAILYAVLMVSIVLTISLTLLDITYKQLVLSSINKESKIAYYAATSAINCAIFWDGSARDPSNSTLLYSPFGSFDFDYNPPNFVPGNKNIRCAGNSVTVDQDAGDNRIDTFTVNFVGGAYAFVTVTKGDIANGYKTTFRVDGYNTTIISSRQVQRSIDTTI